MKLTTSRPVFPLLLLSLLCGAVLFTAHATDFPGLVTNSPGLLGYWKFDSAQPTNSLVNGYTGTNIGGATIGPPGSGAPVTGDPNSRALVLDGTGYLESDLDGGVTNAFTLMCWMNLGALPGSGSFDGYFEVIDQQAFADDADLIVFPSGNLYMYTDAGGGDEVNTPGPIAPGDWHFVVGTMTNGGPRCIYVDGQLMGQNTAGLHHANSAPFLIGYGLVFTPRHYVGSVDEVGYWNRALSQSEVVQLYVAADPPALGTLQSITLNMSAQLPVGGTPQASVSASYSGGNTFDVTGLATLQSSDTSVLSISPSGQVTALKTGTANLTATFGGMTAIQSVTVVQPTVTLTHRYSFSNGNANDSVGTANGTLRGGATFSGGALSLNGAGSVTLPAGIINSNYYALSIEMWATVQRTPSAYPGPAVENVISSFGAGKAYVRLGTHDVHGDGNAWIEANTGAGNDAFGYQAGPIAGNVHLVGVWDPTVGTMQFYLNGRFVNGNTTPFSISSISGANDLANIIGADLSGTTNGIVGSIQEYRIYSGALTADEVRASYAAGPANPAVANGQVSTGTITNVTVSVHPNFLVGTMQDPVVTASSASVQGINLTADPTVSFTSGNTNILAVQPNNQIRAVSPGTTTLTATYQGVSGEVSVTTASATSAMLTHRYSFASDASDSVGQENGVLMGFAKANSGLSLNLEGDNNGGSDYVSFPRDLTAGYPALSVEFWLNLPTQAGSYTRLFQAGDWFYGSGQNSTGLLLSPNYPGPSLTSIEDEVVGVTPADEMDLPVDGAGGNIALQGAGKVQVAATYDPLHHSANLFYNGQLAGAAKFTYPLSAFDIERWVLGKSLNVNDPLLMGTISEFRVYYGALTPGQVAADNTAGAATVGVNSGSPTITDQPKPQTVIAGMPLSLSVGATGVPPLSYQWYLGATPIPGASNAVYDVAAAGDANAGSYTVKINNSVVSQAATVTVQHQLTLTDGLLVHLPFDGNYNDTSGNGNNGQAGGNPTFVPGVTGQAVHLSTVAGASHNYASIPNSTSFSFGGSFSVSFWQRHTGLPNDLPMVGNAVNSTYQPGWVITDDAGRYDATLDAAANGGGVIWTDPAPGPIINDGQWHQMALVIDTNTFEAEYFVDGQVVLGKPVVSLGFVILGSLDDNSQPVTLGSDPTGGYNVSGEYDIDDFGLWTRPLSEEEIQAIYQLGLAGQPIGNANFPLVSPVSLSISQSGGNIQISWSGGSLQSAPTVNGPWAPVSGATVSPYQFAPQTGANQFFRVKF